MEWVVATSINCHSLLYKFLMKKSLPRPKVDFKYPSGLFYCDGEPLSRTQFLDTDDVEPEMNNKYLCGTCGRSINVDHQLLCLGCSNVLTPGSPLKTTRLGKKQLLESIGSTHNMSMQGFDDFPSTKTLATRWSHDSLNSSVNSNDSRFGAGYMESLIQRVTTHREKLLTATTRVHYPSKLKVNTTRQLQDECEQFVSNRPKSPYARSPPRRYGGRQDQLHHLPHHIDVKKLHITSNGYK